MSRVEEPKSEKEISEVICAAKRDKKQIEIVGGGTRNGLGHRIENNIVLDMSGYNGITLYEPDALTLVAKAGTTLKEVDAALKKNGQRLPFEPMSHKPIFGNKGNSTIGGIVACNISGPRRIQAGACRDSLIGVRFVNGAGDIIKNGGRVMKNVTGLDLVKLLCGSHGTLGALSEVAFKVLPISERQVTLAVLGLSVADAIGILTRALSSPFDITGTAHLPNENGMAQTLIRVEGFSNQVDYRIEGLHKSIATSAEMRVIEGEEHEGLWNSVKNVERFGGSMKPLWRVSTTPGNAPGLFRAIKEKFSAQFVFDWGGGLIWVSIDDTDEADHKSFRSIIAQFGGHATFVRASEAQKRSVPVFQPQAPEIAALANSIREKFDPVGILNTGRMTGVTQDQQLN